MQKRPNSKVNTFDVLIVYSDGQAISASSLPPNPTPFAKGSRNESYNAVYGYFLETCRKNNLKAAFTTSADVIGAGKCRSYWLFENGGWIKVREVGFSKLIFDKLSPTRKTLKASRKLLFSSARVRPFNNPRLFSLCFDKQKTYNKLAKFAIPTVKIDGTSKREMNKALRLLKNKMSAHPTKEDFSEEIVMKNRFGAGGRNVYKYNINSAKIMVGRTKQFKRMSFIVQPFIKFNKGFRYRNRLVAADIRLVYIGKKIVQTYIRMPRGRNFICNEHEGGLLKYIPINQVPPKVVAISKSIAKILYKGPSLVALDFICSNNGNVYLLEANTGPGLDWDLLRRENEIEAKKLIRIIVKEIVKRVSINCGPSKRNVAAAPSITTPEKSPILPATIA
jgi:glutathione synthase/RimK-type ligase-like ATP-grasp enzyme